MANNEDRKWLAFIVLLISAAFFAMGFMYPLLQTGYGIGPLVLRQDKVYLFSSFNYFFDQGEIFIGFLLLFFTIIFPALKYLFLLLTIAGKKLPAHRFMSSALDIINKWAMLDVFVVAVLILNMKFDSDIIISRLEPGTTLFAISVVLMMVASLLIKKWLTTRSSKDGTKTL